MGEAFRRVSNRKDLPVRLGQVALTLAVTLVGVAGCSADPGPVAEEPPADLTGACAEAGATVEAIEVSLDLETAPVLEYQAPVEVTRTERMVIVEGAGEEVKDFDQTLIALALYNGQSGDLLGHVGFDGQDPVSFLVDVSAPYLGGISHTLLCSTVGSRVLGVIPADQAYGPDGAPQFGLEPGAPIIMVADILSIQPPPEPPLERLTGVIKDAPEGFPAISYAMSGEPTVTVVPGEGPTDFQMARVIDGSGPEVFPGASVIVHYQGVNLTTGDVFDSSWSRGEPSEFPTSGVVAGFRDGLVGQKVGSRVLIVIPPALGYGQAGNPAAGIGGEDTIFFVVDILGVR